MNVNRHLLKNSIYENRPNFSFSPGHKVLILSFPEKIQCFQLARSRKRERKISNVYPINEITETEEDSENKLLAKIRNYASKLNFKLNIDSKHILGIEKDKNILRCTIQCPICGKGFACLHKSYWLISTFQKHLKSHILEFTAIQQQTTENNSTRIVRTVNEIDNFENIFNIIN